ncbi:WD40-repeat-containing domain protein [Paraphysoderma sedebokerense]|nr:WD40-repeat-containing domain protein [Paraphysoderma sedebokerense]
MYLHLELSVDETILALTSRQGELLFYEIGPHVRDSAKRMETPEDFDDIFEKAKLEASVLNTENEPPVLPSSNEGSDENPEIPSVESVVSSKTKSGRRAQKKQARGQIHTITPQLLSRKFTIPSTFPDPPNQIHPVLLFTKAHGQSVTCVVIQEVLPEHDADVPEYDEQNEPSIENYASSAIKEYRIVTTGRDGVFAQWRYTRTPLKRSDISPTSSNRPSFAKTERPKLHEDIEVSVENNNNLIWLKRVTRERITKGWVERCILVDNEVLLLGFYQRRFWVWNETRKFKMVSIACGGAHRFWHFRTQDSELNNAMFTFIRREYIYAHTRSQKASSPFSSTKLQQTFHGRETRVVKFCRDDSNCHHSNPSVRSVISKLHNVLITASEDCSVRFFEYIDNASFDQRLQDLTSMKKHTSVIRCLDISVGNIPLLFTAGGCEELRCWKLESHGSALTALDCSVCPIVSSVQETRIMDISVFPYTHNELVYHILCLANSDGYIRIFVFDEMNQKFYLLSENNLGKCLLSVKHVAVSPSTSSNSLESVENDHVVLMSTTFGHVHVFSISAVLHAFFVAYSAVPDPKPIRVKTFYFTEPKMKELFKWKPHQSGVNSMDVVRDGNKLLVVTGGDDNALSVSSIDMKDCSVKMETYYTAHASSVTSVKIIRGFTKAEETAQGLYVASAAVDQRVSIWRVSPLQFASGSASTQRDTKNSDLIQLMISKFVNVPDIGDMDVMFDASTGQVNVVAVGLGIELMRCNLLA